MGGRVKQVGEDFIPEGTENHDPEFMFSDDRGDVSLACVIGMRTALGETVVSPAWQKPSGEILTGPMHAIILMDAGMLDDYHDAQQMGWEDGFVTDTGRFVDRAEAAQIMGMAGELESEDLQMAAMRRHAQNTFEVGDRVTNLEPGAPESMAQYQGMGPGTVEWTDGEPGGQIGVKHDNGSLSDGWSSEYTKLEASRRTAGFGDADVEEGANVLIRYTATGRTRDGKWLDLTDSNGNVIRVDASLTDRGVWEGNTLLVAERRTAQEFTAYEPGDPTGMMAFTRDPNETIDDIPDSGMSEERALTNVDQEQVDRILTPDVRMGSRRRAQDDDDDDENWGVYQWSDVFPGPTEDEQTEYEIPPPPETETSCRADRTEPGGALPANMEDDTADSLGMSWDEHAIDGTNADDYFATAMRQGMRRHAGRIRKHASGMTRETVLRSIQRYANVLPMEVVAKYENMLRYYDPDFVMTHFQDSFSDLRELR